MPKEACHAQALQCEQAQDFVRVTKDVGAVWLSVFLSTHQLLSRMSSLGQEYTVCANIKTVRLAELAPK